MSARTTVIKMLRYATDPIAPYSFNRMGFALNRRGFRDEDLSVEGRGRVALVTGANSGIGLVTARELARLGFSVWLACRDEARGEEARAAITAETKNDRVDLAVVDMSKLASVRSLALSLPITKLDVLVHNAGALPPEKSMTEDGVELTFATSVLGPFALTSLLLPCLSRSDDARVIFVASGGMYAQRLDLALLDVPAAKFDGTRAYANAKRAEVILAHEFSERLSSDHHIAFASMHPGWADTGAVRTSLPRFHAVMKHVLRTPEQGADTIVWLAASARAKRTRGDFWFDREIATEYVLPWTRENRSARAELVAWCESHSGSRPFDRVENVERADRTSVTP